MKDRVQLQRKQSTTSTISNPLLAKTSERSSIPTPTVASRHDLSRISLRPQAKLSISQPGDAYEQEADRVATQVMNTSDRALQREEMPEEEEEELQLKPVGQLITPLLQREESLEEEEEEALQMKAEGSAFVRRASGGALTASNDLAERLQSRRGGGSPLTGEVRGFMEPRFGVDFSGVRVHTDSEAVQMSREVGAQAFTYGSDVYFAAGKAPGNNELTAHELTHVVQQRGGNQLQRRKTSGSKDASKSQLSVSTKFLNSGSGLTQKTLGPSDSLTYRANAVEIQFEPNQAVLDNYTNLHPLQWSNPESIWVKKQGDIMTDKWINISQSQGAGADNPLPENIFNNRNTIAYYDSPGINIGPHLDKSRIFVVQNFTGWIAGRSKQGGSPDERISEVVSWHSIVDLSNFSLFDKSGVTNWQRGNDNHAATGWASTGKPSSF